MKSYSSSGEKFKFLYIGFFYSLASSSFDSVVDGSVALFTPHTGFQDPTTPEGTPLRESIELRALVFYD